MFDYDKTHDIVIIGSGAGGGTLAHQLTDTGLDIVILERGRHIEVDDDNWNAHAVFVERKYRTDDIWYDSHRRPFHPNTHYWVGGNTTFYGAALMRMREDDFASRMHADGPSPAWPLSYQDMRPYYRRAERLWQVRGNRGSDPTEPPEGEPYDYPALAHEPPIEALEQHFRGLGWKPFHLPLGVLWDHDSPPGPESLKTPSNGKCIRCTTCGGFPCKINAKSDARNICLKPILDKSNVTLLTEHKAIKLETDGSGRIVREVVCETPQGEVRVKGDIIVVAAGAVPTAALLLASHNASHPEGLANSSSQVGRNYMYHTLSAVVSLTLAPINVSFPKTLGVNDFYWGDPDGSYQKPMGHIQLLEHMSGQTLEGQVADVIPTSMIPDSLADYYAHHMLALLVISEDLPRAENRVTLDKRGRIHLAYQHNNMEGHQRLVHRLDHALSNFSDHRHHISQHHFQLSTLLPIYGTAHQCGTVRFGDDPRTSALDAWCKAHDLDNLYVVDSAFFVSSSAVNPTLTIVANAIRVAEHLRDRLRASEVSNDAAATVRLANAVEVAAASQAAAEVVSAAKAKTHGWWPFRRRA
jgi:choline dehydrogenase-like flavoprotein